MDHCPKGTQSEAERFADQVVSSRRRIIENTDSCPLYAFSAERQESNDRRDGMPENVKTVFLVSGYGFFNRVS